LAGAAAGFVLVVERSNDRAVGRDAQGGDLKASLLRLSVLLPSQTTPPEPDDWFWTSRWAAKKLLFARDRRRWNRWHPAEHRVKATPYPDVSLGVHLADVD